MTAKSYICAYDALEFFAETSPTILEEDIAWTHLQEKSNVGIEIAAQPNMEFATIYSFQFIKP